MEIVHSMNEEDIATTIVSICQSNGQWSKDIFDYQCLGSSSVIFLFDGFDVKKLFLFLYLIKLSKYPYNRKQRTLKTRKYSKA